MIFKTSTTTRANIKRRMEILDTMPIEQVKVMKYLGIQIRDDLKNTEHVKKRIKASFIAEARIKSLGLINSHF